MADAVDAAGMMPAVLTALQPLTVRDQGVHDTTVDNALGAIARILLSRLGPSAAGKTRSELPIPEIIPAYMAALPVREDFAENLFVTESLITLLSNSYEPLQHRTRLSICMTS